MNDFSDLVLTFTDKEMKEHDAEVRADAIDKFISKCVRNGIIGIGTMHDMVLMAEQLKENNNGKTRFNG